VIRINNETLLLARRVVVLVTTVTTTRIDFFDDGARPLPAMITPLLFVPIIKRRGVSFRAV